MSIGKVMQAMEAARHLAGVWWHPIVGAEVENVRLALIGAEGMTDAQHRRLSRWAARWSSIDGRLVDLYSGPSCIDNRTAEAAIFSILEGGKLEPWQYGCLSNLWTEKYGYRPPIEMAPGGDR